MGEGAQEGAGMGEGAVARGIAGVKGETNCERVCARSVSIVLLYRTEVDACFVEIPVGVCSQDNKALN